MLPTNHFYSSVFLLLLFQRLEHYSFITIPNFDQIIFCVLSTGESFTHIIFHLHKKNNMKLNPTLAISIRTENINLSYKGYLHRAILLIEAVGYVQYGVESRQNKAIKKMLLN